MPYFIATHGETDCCCSTKALLLEKRLRELGLQCRQKLCWFRWEDLGLPRRVLEVSHEEKPSHQFLEVLVPETNTWIMVDCTWDKKLAAALPLNHWDGLNPTPCAVPLPQLCTEEESVRIFRECEDPNLVRKYFESEGPFLRAVNEYLAEVRAKYNNNAQRSLGRGASSTR